MVAKMMTPFSVSMGKPSAFVYTSEVGEEDLANAGQLRHSPMMFQERIEKARELRVAYVGGKVFSGAVDASKSAEGGTDWRLASPDECRWQMAELPDEVQEKLKTLMDRLELVFGAVDLIMTPEGDHVFLEVNSAGEWGMLERDLGHPISEAIAEALLDREGGA
jgi:glutathione synthase/RimK-type ligase-like ATP-grasp enzyme